MCCRAANAVLEELEESEARAAAAEAAQAEASIDLQVGSRCIQLNISSRVLAMLALRGLAPLQLQHVPTSPAEWVPASSMHATP